MTVLCFHHDTKNMIIYAFRLIIIVGDDISFPPHPISGVTSSKTATPIGRLGVRLPPETAEIY